MNIPVENGSIAGDKSLPLSLRLITDDSTYQRVWNIAQAMSKSPGLIPEHLTGKPEACFTIIVAALEWRLNPMMVARCTYQTPGRSIGFTGKLVRAIAEASGMLEKPIEHTYYGDWAKVQAKFTLADSRKIDDRTGEQKKYARANWDPRDEEGLGINVI